MGVRLIKPDGRIIDIDTSEFIDVEEGKKAKRKAANLPFRASNQVMTSTCFSLSRPSFRISTPTLSYSNSKLNHRFSTTRFIV